MTELRPADFFLLAAPKRAVITAFAMCGICHLVAG